MISEHVIKPIAVIHTPFKEKFGIPRQSRLVPEITGRIEFLGLYKNPSAINGIEEYSHLWIIWGFSESDDGREALVVHPPRLGGKVKKGVFATRSPYRPNGVGMSVVKLEGIIYNDDGSPELTVSGVDMLDGTPIYDIKPYMPYSDSISDARGGFGEGRKNDKIQVVFAPELMDLLPEDLRTTVYHLLELDPRPVYKKEPDHIYGMHYCGYDIRFRANDEVLTVCGVVKADVENFEKIK